MSQKNILVVGAVGIAVLVGVALVGILLFGNRVTPSAMQPCFDEEQRRLSAGAPAVANPEAFGPAVLVLRLEAQDGKLVVADTELASEGTSSPQLIDCCRRLLESHELAAPVAPPQRYKVQMPLQ